MEHVSNLLCHVRRFPLVRVAPAVLFIQVSSSIAQPLQNTSGPLALGPSSSLTIAEPKPTISSSSSSNSDCFFSFSPILSIRQYQAHILGLNAYERHKKFVKDYVSFYGKDKTNNVKLPVKTDMDTLREGYRFIRTEEDDMDTSWEQRLVKRYYDKLFKEYCIADMSRYKSGKIGLRWRTEKEVISGKGQFICGNKHCEKAEGLAGYEVNFSYFEAGENKQALVKLVACEGCAGKLHYKNRKEKEQLEKKEKADGKRKRERPRTDDDSDEDSEGSKERRKKGKKTSISEGNHEADDESFDEYLEGMFL